MVHQHEYFAYVGCRTSRERNARGLGISVFRIDAKGEWHAIQEVQGLINPSFLCLDRSGNFLYTVHGDGSTASSFTLDQATGKMTALNTIDVRGRNPVHISVDPTNSYLLVANHLTSGVAVISRAADGSLGKVIDLVTLSGVIGPHRTEQQLAKPHQVLFDPSGKFVLVPDKGLDRTFCYRLDNAGRLTEAAPPMVSREGTGPRHLTFHPNGRRAYVLGELDSSVVSCRFDLDSGALTPFRRISSTPESTVGANRAAEIECSPDGRFVYASNRGDDSVGVFKVAPDGSLTSAGWVASGGKTPRFLTITPDGRHLLVANEESDTIITMRIGSNGIPHALPGIVRTGSPVNIVLKAIAS